MTSQEQLVSKCRQYAKLGVPYKHRGMTLRGCDCTGMIIASLKQYFKRYKLRKYPFDWNLHGGAGNYIEEELLKITDEIPKTSAKPGDIIVFRFGKCLAHAGVLVENGLFVHTYVSAKKCAYGTIRNSRWGKRWEKSFRLNDQKLRGLSNG